VPEGLFGVQCDITDSSAVDAAFGFVEAELGPVEVLVANAGITDDTLIMRMTDEQFDRVIDTNLTGAFLCAQAAYRAMKAQQPQGGRIINNGSIAAETPRPNLAAYTASKHAVTGLTKSLSLEGRRYNIACGQIDIGNVQTNLGIPMSSGTLQADFSLKPEPTFDVKHVADAVLYMAQLPPEANVLRMTVMATAMPFVGRG
jgi:NAD(P)-dependent dehydrogenase (short-subunit alcohol dehydrogenase family)